MSNDPAFLWENEGLRSGPRRPRPAAATPAGRAPRAEVAAASAPAAPGEWVSLRDAEARTGIARSTVRNWARKGRIRSHAGKEPGSPRMVDLDDLRRHAAERGYHPPVASPPAPPAGAAPAVPAVPEGSMIVPIDAWERILLQLGNLHEAGRDLAEARERAARAETEAMFLRERLAELREQAPVVAAPDAPDAGISQGPPAAPPPPAPSPPSPGIALRRQVKDLRNRMAAWRRSR